MNAPSWGGAREGSGRKPADYEPSEDRKDYERERAEHERVKREQREFNLAVQRGEYVSRAGVRQASATAYAMFAQSVRSIADNCERKYSLAPEVVEAIQAEVDAALNEVSVALRAMSGET